MDFRDVTLQAIVDFSTQLEAALDGLKPEQWRWRPTPNAQRQSHHVDGVAPDPDRGYVDQPVPER